ncbi:GNAT family N-acetyltransferase [Ureibacillus chungkukjangi]|uniref:Putative GNAT family N-acyltransferase n=1 Tax=Ureibacillus chungkukjangi TaxID=1202712 RepID=A0A318TR16_9BACL|nr:GNAT family N-acetyltransferase [Ureibacillus chungkukjangi]MCM3390071.1 GNAT family N-acetyltransferase [Ureibacillus chungkukjangi]PYF07261.1 putative GNAT family N-acyltransferase [Ureibacillus chungkukjangi]
MQTIRVITQEQLDQAFEIRKEVFVIEQEVPLEDEFDQFDQLDSNCKHILIMDTDKCVGTARLREVDGTGKLERICVLEPFRKLGLGKVIVRELEEIAKEKGLNRVKLHGQTHAEAFYKNLGYETSSDVFMEDGIPHVLMTKKI